MIKYKMQLKKIIQYNFINYEINLVLDKSKFTKFYQQKKYKCLNIIIKQILFK